MELFLLMPYCFNKKKKKMMTVGQTYCSDIHDWPLTPWNKRFWDFFFFFPVLEDFLSVFSLWGEKKKGGDQGFQGAFCLAETVSQKLVFAYMIGTCSLILHVCHVWHSIKPQIWGKCYSFSIVFKYRKVDLWFLAIGGYIVPVRTDSI